MIFIILVLLLVPAFPKTLPPEINKCRISDPNLNKCLDKVAPDSMRKFAAGNKELGIVPLEPLVIPKLEFGDSSSGSVALHQEFTNMKLFGLKKIDVFDTDANFSDDNCFWRFKGNLERVGMEAEYKMTGRLLVIPINGHGKCNNTLGDVGIEYDGTCEKFMKKNKKHMRMTHVSFKTSPKTFLIDFENIIDGNEQLSKEVVKTLNENALEVYGEIGYAVDEALARVWKESVNLFMSRVPEDELFLP